MPERQNNPRPTLNARPSSKNASRTTFANPSDFNKKSIAAPLPLAHDRRVKSPSAKKPPAKGG